METAKRLVLAAGGLIGSACAPVLAQTPSFTLVGIAPGGTASRAYGLSADGSTAAGYSYSTTIDIAYIWTAGRGRYDFGREPGLPAGTNAAGLSGDGSSVVGTAAGPTFNSVAFRWQGPGTFQTLGTLPGGYVASYGEGVSGDGSVVVGRASVGSIGQAFRWTAAGGMRGLGYAHSGDIYSEATASSRDGSTIVGHSYGFGAWDAFTWTAGTGMRVLPDSHNGYAYGVNADGSVVVGEVGSVARLWRAGQALDLGAPSGFRESVAWAVSDDGSVVVGGAAAVGLPNPYAAFIWTPATGSELLSTYLTTHGVNMPDGWSLRDAFAVSADGRTFAGWAENIGSRTAQGFVAVIPAPGTSACLVLGAAVLVRQRRRCSRGTSPARFF